MPSSSPHESFKPADPYFDPLAHGVGAPDLGSAPPSTNTSPVQERYRASQHLSASAASSAARGRSISSASDSATTWFGNGGHPDMRYSGLAVPSFSGTAHAAGRKDSDVERSLVGSLRNSYPFVKDGLCKKTISIQVDGSTQHLISYYKVDDVRNGRLNTPLSLPEIAAVNISPMILHKSNFRNPPDIEVMPDGSLRYRGDGSESSRRSNGIGSGSEGTSGSEGRGGRLIRGPEAAVGAFPYDGPADWQSGRSGPGFSATTASPSMMPSSSDHMGDSRSAQTDQASSVLGAYPRRLSGTFLKDRPGPPSSGRYEPYTRPYLNHEFHGTGAGQSTLWPAGEAKSSSSGLIRHRYTFSGRENAPPVPPGHAHLVQQAHQVPPPTSHSDNGGMPPSAWGHKYETSNSPISAPTEASWLPGAASHSGSPAFGPNQHALAQTSLSSLDPVTRPRGATTGQWHPTHNGHGKNHGLAVPLLSSTAMGNQSIQASAAFSGLPGMLGSSIEHQQQVASRATHLETLASSAGLPSSSAGNYHATANPVGRPFRSATLATEAGQQRWSNDAPYTSQSAFGTPSASLASGQWSGESHSSRFIAAQQPRWAPHSPLAGDPIVSSQLDGSMQTSGQDALGYGGSHANFRQYGVKEEEGSSQPDPRLVHPSEMPYSHFQQSSIDEPSGLGEVQLQSGWQSEPDSNGGQYAQMSHQPSSTNSSLHRSELFQPSLHQQHVSPIHDPFAHNGFGITGLPRSNSTEQGAYEAHIDA